MDQITLVRDIALPLEMAWRSPELGFNVADALLGARTVNWSEWASVERRRESQLSTSATLLSANMDEIATLGHFPEPSPASLTGALAKGWEKVEK